ncbi:MAG: NlpC/P60 family protein [bacterium]|nr:NlpC/P60 family protein [bacterium]
MLSLSISQNNFKRTLSRHDIPLSYRKYHTPISVKSQQIIRNINCEENHLDEIRKGTLIFIERANGIGHVGIYIGKGVYVDCSHNGVHIGNWHWWLDREKKGLHRLRAGNIDPQKVEEWRKRYEELKNAEKR